MLTVWAENLLNKTKYMLEIGDFIEESEREREREMMMMFKDTGQDYSHTCKMKHVVSHEF